MFDASRARFEAWAYTKGWRNFTRHESSGNYVVDVGLELRWIGWQAALAESAAVVPVEAQRESAIESLLNVAVFLNINPDEEQALPGYKPKGPASETIIRAIKRYAAQKGRRSATPPAPPVAAEAAGWWNGLRTSKWDSEDPSGPIYSERESTHCDIPLYPGVNPCNFAEPAAQEVPPMPELKPCPFCGASPLLNIIEPHKHAMSIGDLRMPDHFGSTAVECGCGCGMIDDTTDAVVTRWNRRTPATQPPAQGEVARLPEGWVAITRVQNQFAGVIKAAIELLAAVDSKHANEAPPLKYTIPYGAINQLRAALEAAPPLPAGPSMRDAEDAGWQPSGVSGQFVRAKLAVRPAPGEGEDL